MTTMPDLTRPEAPMSAVRPAEGSLTTPARPKLHPRLPQGSRRWFHRSWAGALRTLVLAAWSLGMFGETSQVRVTAQTPGAAPPPAPVQTIPGMPPVPDPRNLYSETATGRLSPAVAGALPRVYVPNVKGNTVTVIDSMT